MDCQFLYNDDRRRFPYNRYKQDCNHKICIDIFLEKERFMTESRKYKYASKEWQEVYDEHDKNIISLCKRLNAIKYSHLSCKNEFCITCKRRVR